MRALLLVTASLLLVSCDYRDAYAEWCLESGQCDGGAGPDDAGAAGPDGGVADAGVVVPDGGEATDAGGLSPQVPVALELVLAGTSPQLAGSTEPLELLAIAADGGRISTAGSTLEVTFDAGASLAVYRDHLAVTGGALRDAFQVGATSEDAGGTRWFKTGDGSLSATLWLPDGGALRSPTVFRGFEATATWPGDGRTANVPWQCFAEVVTIEGTAGTRIDSSAVSFLLVVDGGARLYDGDACSGPARSQLALPGGRLDALRYSVQYERSAHVTLSSSSSQIVAKNRRETRVLDVEATLERDAGVLAGGCIPAVIAWRIATTEPNFGGQPVLVGPADPVPFRVATEGDVRVLDACNGSPVVNATRTGTTRLPVFMFVVDGGAVLVSASDAGPVTRLEVLP